VRPKVAEERERSSRSLRLNKFLAEAGIASRRKADELIVHGRVQVDGEPARPGQSIDMKRSVVLVDGRRVSNSPSNSLIIVFHKPADVVTTMKDERGRRTVAHYLPKGSRFFPIGRLDAESTGILLCTNDGDVANRLMHPASGVPRTYIARTTGDLTPDAARLIGARDARRNRDGTTTFELTLREGKNRQVRRMCAQHGLRVLELKRTRFGPIRLDNLKPGQSRPLTASELRLLDTWLKKG
jgi:23S rRNA pseudouridine2605 synthase